MIDLREDTRVSTSPVLRYWTKDRSMMISQARDLSSSGISFNAGKEYDKGTPVYIQMRSPIAMEDTITFKAEIMHQIKDESSGLYKTGAKILDFHADDSNQLNKYIEFASGFEN